MANRRSGGGKFRAGEVFHTHPTDDEHPACVDVFDDAVQSDVVAAYALGGLLESMNEGPLTGRIIPLSGPAVCDHLFAQFPLVAALRLVLVFLVVEVVVDHDLVPLLWLLALLMWTGVMQI